MSWQLASYALLAVALAGGFAWYERTRPDSRIVALVGTLAALGALGRIAFAAIPNVKPTTDIVLIAGYALGGGPGFVTGAVAALASNFFFGQGPWTPWQMAGWGVTGLLGAGLAPITGRRIGRVQLAAVCFVVGFAFTALQDLGDWVTYSDHSASQLAVYVGKGLGFDLIHASGCLAFALAFGPALLHSLSRFRVRLQVTWLAPALAVLIMLPTVAAHAAGTPAGYLRAAQNPDGGFGAAPGQPSSPLFSGWAALGLEADGVNPAAVRVARGEHSLLGYVISHPGSDPGSVERSILALSGASADARPLVARLQHEIRRDGSIAEQTNLTAFAILSLRAAGASPPGATYRWLRRQQDGDGGFNFATGSRTAASDCDDTGAVLEALVGHAPARRMYRAVAFLEGQENRDGGFPSQPGGSSNAQSTAFVVQGLIAVGRSGTRGQAYLRSLIRPDGHVAYARGQSQTPVWVTSEAELALAGKPLPLAPVPAPRTARVAPVASKPPVQPHRVVTHRRAPAREIRHRRAAGRVVPDPPVAVQTLVADAGIVAALALAPVDNP